MVVTVPGALRSNNGDLLRRAVLAGEGIALSPTFMLIDDLREGRVVPLLPRYRQTDLAAHAVYPTRRHLPAKVRAFVDLLAETLRDPPAWDGWVKQKPRRG